MTIKLIPKLLPQEIVPQGSNSLSSKDKFNQNNNYETFFNYFKNVENLGEFSFIDTRHADKNYCKLNNNNLTINLNDGYIKNIPNSYNVYALSFVVDAFFELERTCKTYYKNNILVSSTFGEISAKSGWVNINSYYHDYMISLYNIFLKDIETKYKNIYTFKDFLKYFIIFLTDFSDKYSVLKTSYIMSSNSSINSTGMAIEIDNLPKDQDLYKYNKYFTDIDFIRYQRICEFHGFSIDKYCPWRLVFNIKNPNSQKYMHKYNINQSNIYDELYVTTIDYDIQILVSYCTIFYNTFINDNKLLEKTKIQNSSLDNSSIIKSQKIISETNIDYNTAISYMGEIFWHKLYFHILFLETKLDLEQTQYENYINILSSLSINRGIKFAKTEFIKMFNDQKKTNTKKFTFMF